MKQIRVKPADGLEIKDSKGKVIPKTGGLVDKTVEILRHIREGALILVNASPKKKQED